MATQKVSQEIPKDSENTFNAEEDVDDDFSFSSSEGKPKTG